MKVIDLIHVLSGFDGNSEVTFRLGRNEDYRMACALLAAEDDGTYKHDGLGCLICMTVDSEKPVASADDANVVLRVKQAYYEQDVINKKIEEIRLLRKGAKDGK
jgi:hypothetical protein